MHNLCKPEDQNIINMLKDDIVAGPTLATPYSSRIFYIKTGWYKYGMGDVLLQVDNSLKSIKL